MFCFSSENDCMFAIASCSIPACFHVLVDAVRASSLLPHKHSNMAEHEIHRR